MPRRRVPNIGRNSRQARQTKCGRNKETPEQRESRLERQREYSYMYRHPECKVYRPRSARYTDGYGQLCWVLLPTEETVTGQVKVEYTTEASASKLDPERVKAEPTDLTETADLLVPTDLMEPTDMIEPTGLLVPTDLIDTADLLLPTDLMEPANLIEPTGLAAPTDLIEPTDWIEPMVKSEPATSCPTEAQETDEGMETTFASALVKTEMQMDGDGEDEDEDTMDGFEEFFQEDSCNGPEVNELLEATGSFCLPIQVPDRCYNERKRLYQCPYCEYQSHSSAVSSHISMHTNTREFRCRLCEFRTNYKNVLHRHERAHDNPPTKAPKKKFRCQQCDYVTAYRHALTIHIGGKHSTNKAFNCNGPEVNELIEASGSFYLPIPVPDRCYNEQKRLYQCPYCEYQSHSSAVSSHISMHTNTREFRCQLCEFRTNYKNVLHRHERAHDNPPTKAPKKKFRCQQCDYVTAYRHALKIHIGGKHSTNKAFKCDVCEYCTKYATALRRHVLSKHSNSDCPPITEPAEKKPKELKTYVKKFKCTQCEYITAHRHALKSHLGMHSDDKPYKCVLCQYCTKYSTALRRHRQTMHVDNQMSMFDSFAGVGTMGSEAENAEGLISAEHKVGEDDDPLQISYKEIEIKNELEQ